ncbi:MAG: hypothetical protein WA723_08420, partial [Pseudolabrys sp.]
AQPSAQPLRRHGKIQIGTIDSKLSTMSIFKSGFSRAPLQARRFFHKIIFYDFPCLTFEFTRT